MRNLLNEIQQIDSFLLDRLSHEEQMAFRARLILEDGLSEKVEAQQYAHRLIRIFARLQGKRRLENLHQRMFQEPSFKRKVLDIFEA